MSTSRTRTLVLGAGPSGIAAGIRLADQCMVVDRTANVGGQSGSLQIGEAVFDIGGHSFHTPHQFVRDLVYNALDMYEQPRNAKCFSHGTLIPYPFQKHFRLLPDERVVAECSEGLQNHGDVGTAANFKDFITARFGRGIARHFMLPYNEKLWARDLALLDTNWVGERVAAPEGVKEKFDLTGGKRKPLQANTAVAYPAKGGFGEIYKALARGLRDLRLGVDIRRIDVHSKRAYAANGDCYVYDDLISTLPLTELFPLLSTYPAELHEPIGKLQHMSLKCAMVAVDHPVDTEIQRIYCADPSIPAHKIAVNHNSSDWLRARSQHGIMGEISYSAFKMFPRSDLLDWFIDGLVTLGLIRGRDEVAGAKLVDVKYAYPVPTHQRPVIVETLKSFLAEIDIHTVGRFGEWAYINSDEALARGFVLGDAIAHERPPLPAMDADDVKRAA